MAKKGLCEEKELDRKKRKMCQHLGYNYCVLYEKELKLDKEGWRICHNECPIPFNKEKNDE